MYICVCIYVFGSLGFQTCKSPNLVTYFNFPLYYPLNTQKCKEVQDCKILKLGKNSLCRDNPNKVIYNFSSVTLSDSDKSLLRKGLNIALSPASLEFSE